MFSAAGKMVSYLFGGSDDAVKPESVPDYENPHEPDVAVNRRDFEGKVSHVFSGHGLVDSEVYFSFDDVLGGARPGVGHKVHVVAVQQHHGGGWHAEQLTVVTDWEEGDDDIAETDNSRPSEVVGTVTYSSGQTGNINNHIFYDLAECKCGAFRPGKGDWVKVTVKYEGDNVNDVVVTNIQHLRVKETEGVISGELGDHGYIDGEVFYARDSLQDGYRPRKWEPVHYVAVESQQGRCSWRAVSVQPSDKPHIANIKVLQGPLQRSFTKELLANKEGISVTEKTDFGSVAVGTSRKLVVWVKNNGDKPQKFVRCHLTAASSQMSIKDIRLLKEVGGRTMDDLVTGEVTLYPAMSLYVSLHIEARSQGQEKPLMVFTFEEFKIGRYVTASVTDPLVGLVEMGAAFKQEGTREGYQRYKATVESQATPWTLPGQRPSRANKRTVQYPNHLPQYSVPSNLQEATLDPDRITQLVPVLDQELCMGNYRERLGTLLHLEEIQMDIDIREFDLHRVCMRRVGEYLGLQVPGLAEGRPSVLIGDSVYLTDPADPDGPCFEGFVHETFKDEVLLKFNPNFQRSYTGKDYNVVFTFNRGSLRKCHRATEMAKGLGEKTLFPAHLQARPAQWLSQKVKWFNQQLNARQRAAVTRILQGQGRPLPYILFGPPGTGKTVTVVEAILQVFSQMPYSRIIACTPSNSAADLIAQRLHESGLLKTGDMVRLNAMQRSDESIPDCIRPYCTVGDDIDLASRYRVLVSTCVSAGVMYSLGIKAGHFTHVFIDEAGQATEPEALISACLVSQTDGQVVLAGDPQQLGPVLRSRFSLEYGLGISLLERLIHTPLYERDELRFSDHGAYDPLLVTKLVENYRNHQAILDLPSQLFYHGELEVRADPKVTDSFCQWTSLPTLGTPVIFHGVRGEDLREGNSPSWFNPAEIVQVVRYLQAVLGHSKVRASPGQADGSVGVGESGDSYANREVLNEGSAFTCDDVGIITPYRKQVEKIRLMIDKLGLARVKVGSVEEFQGQERPVIIISTVRSNEDLVGFDERHTLGFLSNPKRFNVAITRAQALLIVIGNPHVLTQDKYWRALLDYCVDLGAYVGCELPPTELDI
ncbi:RNA helicase Mov10l1-like isoform X2 [Mya arenaria]|uniref:RNA helicase Mov10l1-like isoform X2 n=1 Tax=Mya arenaria TaxID=6604 RepID=UPI0022E43CE8|nr:RNA helicase Mov10l1-like isoform X2 [Mya arenaria]